MLTTPLPARAPYSDAPAAPLTTSTFSMSLGLMSGRLPLMMMPSTMYRGSWPRPAALIDVGPRSRIAGCAPGRPLAETMFAPGTFPWSCARGLAAGTGSCDASTRDTVNGTFTCSVASCTPVTTTASSRLTSYGSVRSTVCSPGVSVIALLFGLKPIPRARTTTCWPRTRAPGTTSEYSPVAFVEAPSRSSSTTTFAPETGSPRSEMTFPRITASCARAVPAPTTESASAASPAKSTPRQLWTIESSSRGRGIRDVWTIEQRATSRTRSRFTKAGIVARTSATVMTLGCQGTA